MAVTPPLLPLNRSGGGCHGCGERLQRLLAGELLFAMFLHSTAVLLGRPCTYDALPPLPSLPVHLRCSATALTVGWALWTTALAAPAASVRCGADVQKWESLLGGVPDPHNQQP